MRRRSSAATFALLLIFTIILVAPQKTHAIPVSVIADIGLPKAVITAIESTLTTIKAAQIKYSTAISAIKNTISAAANVATKISAGLLVVDRYVIQPLAFIMSGNLLKAMTSSVVSFVIGQSNGTGIPQFVQNVSGLMQNVGDKQASVFLAQLSKSPNSPFAASIASSLSTTYLEQTSAAGFFAANQCTLTQASPDINAFLDGDWSKGGARAWFALTTQDQNNPYTLYQVSQSQLSTLVGTAQAASTKQLDWGKGFLSWCGASDGPESFDDDGVSLGASGPTPNCTKDDGSPGTIQTPGSYISETLSKAVGASQDKLVQAGNAGKELNSIMGSIATVMQSVNLASRLLGGAGNALGLAGAAQPSGTNRSSLFTQYQTTPGYAGATTASVFQNAGTLSEFGGDMSSRIAAYQAAWNTITSAANKAKISLGTSTSSCPEIQLILAQAAAASTTITDATIVVRRVQTSLSSSTDETVGSTYNDMQQLQNMEPTSEDVATAQSNARSAGVVNVRNASSLDGSQLSFVDQMDLVSLNKKCLEPPADFPVSPLSLPANDALLRDSSGGSGGFGPGATINCTNCTINMQGQGNSGGP